MSYYAPTHTGSYPYGAYSGYSQAPGAYSTTPYQQGYPATGVTSYGTWSYTPYNYYTAPHQHQQIAANAPKPPLQQATATATSTPTVAVPPRVAPIPTTQTYTFAPSYTGGTTAGRSGRKQTSYKGSFTKELRSLMYGFGDDRNPSADAVSVMEEILVEYIVDVCQVAVASGKNKSRLTIEDLRRALSRPADAKKLARMEELLFMREDINRARAQFEEADMNQNRTLQD